MTGFLAESRGFAARKSGDSFVDPTNKDDTATFEGIDLLPEDQPSFATHSDFADAYAAWKTNAEQTSSVYEINSPISVIRAAMIVNMDTPRGSEKFVLFAKDMKNPEGKLTSIPPHVIPNHGGYVLNRQTSLSERAGLKPSDLLSGSKMVRPKEVSALLNPAKATAGDAAVEQMQSYLDALAKKQGKDFRIVGGAEYASLHQKYLGEWAAPIALITGQFDPLSQLPDLEDSMLEGKSVKNGKIVYNTNPTEALFDSSVVVDSMEIAISSKAHKGGGAAASLKGLSDTIENKADEFGAKFWTEPRHQKFKHIVETIMGKSAVDGVLELAVAENIMPRSDMPKIQKSIRDRTTEDLTVKTQRLMADYAANENHPQYNQGRHALASVARALCNKLNAEDYTDVAKAILNKSNVVQMMFVTGKSGSDLIAKGFELIWPPQFDGSILFYSGKNFMATETKGKLGFKIKKGGGRDVEEPDESLSAPSLTKTQLAAAKKQAEKAVGKIVEPGRRDQRDPTVKDEIALGRAKKPRS